MRMAHVPGSDHANQQPVWQDMMHSRQLSTEGNCQVSSKGVHIADIPVLEAWHGVSFCPRRALTACLHVFDLQTKHTKLCMARPHAILMQHVWYKLLVTQQSEYNAT